VGRIQDQSEVASLAALLVDKRCETQVLHFLLLAPRLSYL